MREYHEVSLQQFQEQNEASSPVRLYFKLNANFSMLQAECLL